MVLGQYLQGIPIFPIFPKNSDKSKTNFIFMEKITFNHYKNAIQEHYEIKKNDDITGILLNPTPAQLRNYCSFILDKGLIGHDEEIFRNFFETKNGESLKRSIDNCNTDKFKTIISFLKEKRDSEISLRVELSAILIGFNPRPYNKYNSSGGQIKNDKIDLISIPSTEINQHDEDKMSQVVLVKKPNQEKNKLNTNLKKKIAIGIVSFIGLSSIGYTAKNTLFSNKECMQWQENHYEYVDCDKKSLLELYPIIPIDESLINLRKIEVSKKTPFFCNGKPNIWYFKHNNGKIEFYNSHGIHPETGKPLKAITNYMINKYVK